MSETRIGDIYVEKADTVRAFMRPLDGSPPRAPSRHGTAAEAAASS